MYNVIQTSVAHIRPYLLPEWAEQTGSETVVGRICHQIGQTLTDRTGQVRTISMQH